MPIGMSFGYIGVPVGDLVSAHPDCDYGNFQVTSVAGGVPANGTLIIRNEIKNLAPQADITDDNWNCLTMPIFSWMIFPIDGDLTLEVRINNGGFGVVDQTWKFFVLSAGIPNVMDDLHVPACFCKLVLHNSLNAANGVNGTVRMRAL